MDEENKQTTCNNIIFGWHFYKELILNKRLPCRRMSNKQHGFLASQHLSLTRRRHGMDDKFDIITDTHSSNITDRVQFGSHNDNIYLLYSDSLWIHITSNCLYIKCSTHHLLVYKTVSSQISHNTDVVQYMAFQLCCS